MENLSVVEKVTSSLSDNPYFSAGAGIFGLGLGTAVLKRALQGSLILFRRHLMITMEGELMQQFRVLLIISSI